MINFKEKSIKNILSMLENREISVMDIATSCVSAYEQFNQDFLPFESFKPEILFHAAQLADQRLSENFGIRVLEGIPFGIKDNMNTADFKTQMGSPIWKDFTPGNDARVVEKLKWSGALIAGKTVTAEFAVHALNKTLNPYNTVRSPGTSSTGSAVAVACGIVPASLGTQTAGSIIRPASYNGVYGFKPSYGLLPRTGILKSTDTLDSVGYYVSFVEDLALILSAMCVQGSNYPMVMKGEANCQSRILELDSRKYWKVGIFDPEQIMKADDYAKHDFFEWVERLKSDSNFNISSFTIPDEFFDAHEIHQIIYHKCLAYYFQREYLKHDLISVEMNSCIRDGLTISNEDYNKALDWQRMFAKVVDNIFQQYDVIISLSTAGHAPLRTEQDGKDLCLIWTMSYVPSLNIPLFCSPLNLPFGAQIVSRRYHDKLLLKFAETLSMRNLIPLKSSQAFQRKANSPEQSISFV